MAGMNKTHCVIDIGPGQLLWQGRPAPRCYTLRHWRRALHWGVVLLVTAILQMWIWHARNAGDPWSMVFLPTPLLLLAFALSFGRLIRARLEWEHVFYLISDTGVHVQDRRKKQVTRYPYALLKDVRLELYCNSAPTGLGWVHMQFGKQRVTLECLEDAHKAYTILTRQLQQQSRETGWKKAEQRCENKR